MDEKRFDELIKRLAEAKLTRSETIRGVAAGAGVALASVVGIATTAAKPGGKGKHKGKGKGKGKGNGKGNGNGDPGSGQQVTICHRPPGNPHNCQTITVGAKAAQKHIQQHGDTLGPCPYGC